MADFREVMREFEQMPGRIERVLGAAMRRCVRLVESEARKNAPKSPTQAEEDHLRTRIYGADHTKRIKRIRSIHAKGATVASLKKEKSAKRRLKKKLAKEKKDWNKVIGKARSKNAKKARREKKAERKIMQRINRQERTAAKRERRRERKAIQAEKRRARRGRRRRK